MQETNKTAKRSGDRRCPPNIMVRKAGNFTDPDPVEMVRPFLWIGHLSWAMDGRFNPTATLCVAHNLSRMT